MGSDDNDLAECWSDLALRGVADLGRRGVAADRLHPRHRVMIVRAIAAAGTEPTANEVVSTYHRLYPSTRASKLVNYDRSRGGLCRTCIACGETFSARYHGQITAAEIRHHDEEMRLIVKLVQAVREHARTQAHANSTSRYEMLMHELDASDA